LTSPSPTQVETRQALPHASESIQFDPENENTFDVSCNIGKDFAVTVLPTDYELKYDRETCACGCRFTIHLSTVIGSLVVIPSHHVIVSMVTFAVRLNVPHQGRCRFLNSRSTRLLRLIKAATHSS
jgi:hypothetical protein